MIERDIKWLIIIILFSCWIWQGGKKQLINLIQSITLAEDSGLKKCLKSCAEVLLTDKYRESDKVWLEMKGYNNVGCYHQADKAQYYDKIICYKRAHRGYILVKEKIFPVWWPIFVIFKSCFPVERPKKKSPVWILGSSCMMLYIF